MNQSARIELNHIQGKLVACSMEIDLDHLQLADRNFNTTIKRDLARQIADFMVHNNMIEYVKQDMLYTRTVRITARVFVTPNDEIKTIRNIVK